MSEIKGQLRFIETTAAIAHEALSTFVEAVIFYHSKQESTSGKFVGLKERVRIGLNMYHSSPLDYPKEKVYLFQTNEQKKRFQPKRFKGRKRNKKNQTRKFLSTPRRKSRMSMTRTEKMNILWKKMMTMIPLHL